VANIVKSEWWEGYLCTPLMRVYTDIALLPRFKNTVITIGTFDGVHLGHRKIIEQLISEAGRVGGETVIVTFHPHPRQVVRTRNEKVQLLTTIEERAELLQRHGVDNLVIVPFNRNFSEQSPEEYVEKFLVSRFSPQVVIIGYDHKFGKERQGDYKLLEAYSERSYFELKEIPQQVIADNAISSTRIRTALNEGDVLLANRLLGYEFFFDGIVVRGDQRGRMIGFPTANIQLLNEDKLVPANGVYAVQVAGGTTRSAINNGMMNIGVRPTVDGTRKTIEVNIFDFDQDLYGTTLRVYMKDYLRSEMKFGGLDELKMQLGADEKAARDVLEK
jgi:riboflavin kinase/FMN adenylyltransferase